MKNERTTIELSQDELLDILKQQEVGTFAELFTCTNVRMNKTKNPYYDKVKKFTQVKVLLGVPYSTRIRNVRNDPNFVPQESKVGESITRCIRYNEKYDRFYLDYEWFEENKPINHYEFEGDQIGKELFESFLVKYQEREILFHSVMVSNINEIHMNGFNYKVVR